MPSGESPVALVTGAAGGIGAAVCARLAASGWRIGLHYSSNASGAKALAARLGEGNSAPLKADLSKPGAAKPLIAACLKAFGRLDLLVNNAGAVLGQSDFMDMTEADWDKTLRLNATAPFFLTQAAFRAMKSGGRVVNVSSIAVKFGGSARSMHYAAAKAAVETMTVSFAKQGAPKNILVNCVRAGVIDTPFHGKFSKDMKRRVAVIPLKRMGKADDVASLIAHLAGPGGDFITGQVISVTGGE